MCDSSIIIEGIKTVLFFFYEKISQAQTAKKSRLSLKRLLYAQKAQKAQIAKKADFH